MSQSTNLTELRKPAETAVQNVSLGFSNQASFELMIRAAKLLSSSTLVPAAYQAVVEKKQGQNVNYQENPNAIPNCVIALNMARRMNADELMVMQNLYIVEGRPSWSSQWIIAAINGCGRFSPLRFDIKDEGDKDVEYTVSVWNDSTRRKEPQTKKQKIRNLTCVAWAIEKETGERIESPKVSMEMAVKEGWYGKNGSKWQTMPEVMLRYRTASFFGKLYAPELLMGLQSVEEAHDIIDVERQPNGTYAANLETLRAGAPTEAPAETSDNEASAAVQTPAESSEQAPAESAEQNEQAEQQQDAGTAAVTYAQVADAMTKAKTQDELDEAADLIKHVADEGQRGELGGIYEQRKDELDRPAPRTRQPRQATMNVD